MRANRRLVQATAFAAVLALCVVALSAQGFRRGRRFFEPVRSPTADSYDGAFSFCRIIFPQAMDGDGGGWMVDYPRADINLSIRYSELTKARISRQPNGEPNHVVIDLNDPYLFQCPFIMMTEVGALYMGPEEAQHLREYLQKGGFLWADDFWGSYAWDYFEREIRRALPADEYPIVDLPPDHPLFRSQFVVEKVIQIPSINSWAGGWTSERGSDSAVPHARGISDSQGRLMALITFNTDYGDAFEREGDDPRYFYTFSVDGYALGINTLLYAMTH